MSNDKASKPLAFLDPQCSDEPFPPVEQAWAEPNGLLAFGGDLSPARLIKAYQSGIFPWYNPDEPIYWWCPDPRAVLYPDKIHISKSLRKSIRKLLRKGYSLRFDTDFEAVVKACAVPRMQSGGTWITNEMLQAYTHLHQLGVAHSVEIWNHENKLVGGLYGIATGGVFSGESMFSTERDVSKIAFVTLAWHMQHWGFSLIDCQIENSHLTRMGAENIDRKKYLQILKTRRNFEHPKWHIEIGDELSQWQTDADENTP